MAEFEKNASEPVYLSYFGMADVRAYGVSAIMLTSSSSGISAEMPFDFVEHLKPGFFAISASMLQGVYNSVAPGRVLYVPLPSNVPSGRPSTRRDSARFGAKSTKG